jgi:hypothetical protein
MKLNAITLSGVGEALTIPATSGGSLVHAHELIVLLPHQRNTTQRSLLLGVSIDRSMAWLTIVRDSWWCAPAVQLPLVGKVAAWFGIHK